jgi:hypothetical protein
MPWAFLLMEKLAIPFQKVPCRLVGHVADLGQAPMRGLAFAINAKATSLSRDNEAVVPQFSKGTRDGFHVKARLIGAIAGGNCTVI